MNNLSIFPVSPVAVFAAGCVAGTGGSHFLSRSLLRTAQSVLGAAVLCCLGLLRFVVMFASNPALKWDAPSARPLATRWAYPMNLFKLVGLYLLCHAGLAIAEAPITLCTSQEKVYFSCVLHRKIVSLCATSQNSPTETYLQYRIGKPGLSSELELPHANIKAKDFFRYNFESRSAKGSIFNIAFDSGDYSYTIYRFTHAFEGNSSGVAVKKQGKIISYLKCDERSVIANFSDINAFSFAKDASVEIVEEPE